MDIAEANTTNLSLEPLQTLAQDVLADKGLLSGLLTGPRSRQPDSVTQVQVKPLLLRGEHKYQFTYQQQRKVLHRNLDSTAAQAELTALLSTQFKQGVFQTTQATIYVTVNKRFEAAIRRETSLTALETSAHTRPASVSLASGSALPSSALESSSVLALQHDRPKNHILPEGKPVAFLVRLGIMASDGKVLAAKRDKFRQINRFLEMVADVTPPLEERLAQTPDVPLHIVDFGCGKAYLTFALYYYLHVLREMNITLVGVDLKQDVLAQCSALARELNYDGLTFAVGDIQSFDFQASVPQSSELGETPPHPISGERVAGTDGVAAVPAGIGETRTVDMVVALHACDTATDDALVKAVAWNAHVILAAPCCQHELFRKIENSALQPMLRHGIVRERLAALVTDTLRAELLTTYGYGVQMLEFVEAEHTPKNILIRAVKQASSHELRSPESLKSPSPSDAGAPRRGVGERSFQDSGHENKGNSSDQDAKIASARASYTQFRDFWHIQPYIEQAFAQAMLKEPLHNADSE